MSDNDTFITAINAFVDKAKENQEAVVRSAGIKILTRLVLMSPVGDPDLWKVNAHNTYARDTHNLFVEAINADPENKRKVRRMVQKKLKETFPSKAPKGYTGGRFRGNWQVSFESPAEWPTDRIDKNGAKTIAAGVETLEYFRVGTKAIYFTNNLPYAYPLEFGHSSQAPNGMIRVTAAEFQQYFDAAAQEVNK